MKDYLGNDLAVGDEVVYMAIGYRWFTRARITKLGEKKASLLPLDEGRPTTQFYYQIIKVL